MLHRKNSPKDAYQYASCHIEAKRKRAIYAASCEIGSRRRLSIWARVSLYLGGFATKWRGVRLRQPSNAEKIGLINEPGEFS